MGRNWLTYLFEDRSNRQEKPSLRKIITGVPAPQTTNAQNKRHSHPNRYPAYHNAPQASSEQLIRPSIGSSQPSRDSLSPYSVPPTPPKQRTHLVSDTYPAPPPIYHHARPHSANSFSSSHLQTPPRQQPPPSYRPTHLQTPPRTVPSPTSLSTPTRPAPSNQCRGTTAKGQRCTRLVGSASTPAKGQGRASRENTPSKETRNPDMPSGAMRQLDRMLSIRSRKHPRTPRSARKAQPTIEEDDDSDDEDYNYPLSAPANSSSTSLPGTSEGFLELPVFCYQHAKQALAEPGVFVGNVGNFQRFEQWIPEELPTETKLQLRHEMSKPVSAGDRIGYIYVHEMVSATRQNTTYIKVGKSTQPVARLSQWRKQCPSRTPIVRDLFPLAISHDQEERSRLRGTLGVASHGAPYYGRWERLCLIELAGRAAMEAGVSGRDLPECEDCGQRHLELFKVQQGAYERWVRSVITRWQSFVELLSQ